MAKVQRDPVREQQWRERVGSWQSSGLTIREFCLRHGLVETTFHFWRRELRTRDAATSFPSSPPPSQPTFVPVTVLPNRANVAATAEATPAVTVEIRCPSGHLVTVSSCDSSILAGLFTALAALPSSSGEVTPC
jgi:transposase